MSTKKDSAVAEVPTVKVARVGEGRRKRKVAGFPFFRGAGTRGAWTGAAGGSGSGVSGVGGSNAFSMGAAKTILAILLSAALAPAAVYFGNWSAAKGAAKSKEKPAPFAHKDGIKIEGDTSHLPSNPNAIPNSLGYIAGSIDGLTPEERAKREAEEAEAQRKAEEESRSAHADAAGKNGGNPLDVGALLAASHADVGGNNRGGWFGPKLGPLGSPMGGAGLVSGGSGVSGGGGSQLAGTAASSNGGDSDKLTATPGTAGKLTAMKIAARPTSSAVTRARSASSKVQGFARRQLANANGLSRQGTAPGAGETASYAAGAAFDNNKGANNVITGAGIGSGARPAGTPPYRPPDAINVGGPIVTGPKGTSDGKGGVTSDGTPVCSDKQTSDPKTGACVDIATPKKEYKTPWLDRLTDYAQKTLLGISVAAIAAMAMGATGFGAALVPAVLAAIGVAGAALAAMGATIAAMGDYFAGAIFIVVGAFIGLSAASLVGLPALTAGRAIISTSAGLLLNQARKMLKAGAAD